MKKLKKKIVVGAEIKEKKDIHWYERLHLNYKWAQRK